jgi:hypothetical protein
MKKHVSGLEIMLPDDLMYTKINRLAEIILSSSIRKDIRECAYPDDDSYYLYVSLPKLDFEEFYKEFEFDRYDIMYQIGQSCSYSTSRNDFMKTFKKRYIEALSEHHKLMAALVSAVRSKLMNEEHGDEIDAITIKKKGYSDQNNLLITETNSYECSEYNMEFTLFGYGVAEVLSRKYKK